MQIERIVVFTDEQFLWVDLPTSPDKFCYVNTNVCKSVNNYLIIV